MLSVVVYSWLGLLLHLFLLIIFIIFDSYILYRIRNKKFMLVVYQAHENYSCSDHSFLHHLETECQ